MWNTLTPGQQALTDPDFAGQAELGRALTALEIQHLSLRRDARRSQLRQFMRRFDLLATPSVAVPAFDARPAGQAPMNPHAVLGWAPFSEALVLRAAHAFESTLAITRPSLAGAR